MRTLAGGLTLVLAMAGTGRPESLAELEAAAVHGPTVTLAETDVALGQARLDGHRAESGFKIFSGATVANEEGDPGTDIRNFQGAGVLVGVRHPLFGTRSHEQLDILGARTQLDAAKARVRLAERQAVLEVRRQYAHYWGGQQMVELARGFLGGEDRVSTAFAARREAGLLLEADRREFMTAFSQARRTAADAEGTTYASLDGIRRLVGRPVAEFVADEPVFPPACLDVDAARATVVAGHPELVVLRAVLREKEEARNFAGTLPVESGVNLSQLENRTFVDNQKGRATVLGVDVRFPLDFVGAYRARRDEAAAAFAKARLELAMRERELAASAARAIELYRVRRESLRFATDRVASAEEGVREAALRRAQLAGDVIEKHQQALFHRYRAAVDLARAQVALHEAHAELLALVPDGCSEPPTPPAPAVPPPAVPPPSPVVPAAFAVPDPTASVAPAIAVSASGGDATPPALRTPDALPCVAPTPGSISVYVWNAAPLLADDPTGVVARFTASRVGRLLLSLDAKQIEHAQTPAGATRLTALLDTARAEGLRVELLLGDPDWIFPNRRDRLVAIVRALARFHFSGLHLDVEPNQLDSRALGEEFLLRELLATLAAVQAASPWALGLSIHPRYMMALFDGTVFGARLAALAPHEVTLMIYVADPERVHAIAAPIVAAYPQLRFTVAQSIEPALAPDEGQAIRSRAALGRAKQRLASLFAGTSNFKGIVLQAWEHYASLQP
jgi:outer membrane protein TolC